MRCSPLRIQILKNHWIIEESPKHPKINAKVSEDTSNRQYRTLNNWINLFQPVYLDELTVRALMHTVEKDVSDVERLYQESLKSKVSEKLKV